MVSFHSHINSQSFVNTNVREVNNLAKLSVYILFLERCLPKGILCVFTVILCRGVTKIACVYTELFSKHTVALWVLELITQKHKSDSTSCRLCLDF